MKPLVYHSSDTVTKRHLLFWHGFSTDKHGYLLSSPLSLIIADKLILVSNLEFLKKYYCQSYSSVKS